MRQRLAGISAAWLLAASAALAAEPIRIGLVAEGSGANAAYGQPQILGAKLALEEINKAGGVLGRPLELQIEDNESTNPGSVRALTKLVEQHSVVAMVGTVRSTQALAMMPVILRAGIPIVVGGTDHTLTHAGNPWIFRARPHDGYSAKVVAGFGVETLGRSRWAVVHSTEAFGIGGKNHLVEALKAYNIAPVAVLGANSSNVQDFSQIARTVKQSGADIVAVYIAGPTDSAEFAVQLRAADVNAALIGSPSLTTETALKHGAAALHGSYSISDFVAESNPEAKAFAQRYKERFGSEADLFSSWTYDAVNILALAIRNAHSTQPAAIRRSMLSIRGYKGAEGAYTYDENGDGLHGYNVVKNEQGKIVFIKHVAFP